MKWKKINNYLVYINEESINDFISMYKINCIDNRINLEDKEVIELEKINNIVYYPKIYKQSVCTTPNLNNNGEENLNKVSSIKIEIIFRIEYFNEKVIKTKAFNIEFNDIFISNTDLDKLNIYINTMAINFNVQGELSIPIIYTLYTKNYM